MAADNGRCPCGQVHFQTSGRPIFRAICHCTICQSFNNAAFGDILAYRASQITNVSDASIDYRVHRQPPLLKRGLCRSCNKPALEKLNVPFFPKIMLVPAERVANVDAIAKPDFHIFYEHRVADHDDGLHKARGYLPSQMTFATRLLSGLMRRHPPTAAV